MSKTFGCGLGGFRATYVGARKALFRGWLGSTDERRLKTLGTPKGRASGKLSDKHIEQEAPFVDELDLSVTQLFLSRQWRDVQPWKPVNE